MAPRPRPAAWLAVPLLVAAAAYARVLHGEFLLDDFPSIVEAPGVRDLGRTLRALVPELLRGGRPVTDVTFALNYAAGGLDPWGYHLVNLALHVAVVVLVFLFTRTVLRLSGARPATVLAVVVAGTFALHPLQTQAVSYVVQRSEVLASGLYLASLLLLLRAERSGRTPRGALAYASALAAFVLGLGAKAIVVTMPAAYLLLTWAVPDGPGRGTLAIGRRRAVMLAPWVGVAAWFSFATARSVEGSTHVGFAVQGLGPGSYFLSQLGAVATYLRLLLLPVGQNGYWVVPTARSLSEPGVLASGLVLVAVLAGALSLWVWARRRTDQGGAAGRVASFGVAWFFLVLAPTSSVVPLADLVVEHRVYLASWGVIVAATVGLARVIALLREDRRALSAGVAVAVTWVALGALLHRRNAVWESRLAFWSDAVAGSPRAQRPHLNLAHALWERGRFGEAVDHYHLALDFGGRATQGEEAFLQNNLGVALISAGRVEEAVAALTRATELDPGNANAFANLALLAFRRGDLEFAEREVERALRVHPDNGGALEVLGGIRLARGDPAGAIDPLERAVRLAPDDGERWLNLAQANERLGRTREACSALRRVVRLPVEEPLRQTAATRAAALGCPR
jgi:Flp pilus assembly protein TadD